MRLPPDTPMDIYFTDFFQVPPEILEEYGAFNVSLISDLPLFIDPFLLFNSEKEEYQRLHEQMIDYLRFLRDKSVAGDVEEGLLKSWFTFSEVGLPKKKRLLCSATRARTVRGGKGRVSPSVGRGQAGTCGSFTFQIPNHTASS